MACWSRARAARRDRFRARHRRTAGRLERREQPEGPRARDRYGHALPAAARLHRSRHVHVLAGGRILEERRPLLGLELERRGYDWVLAGGRSGMSAGALARYARPYGRRSTSRGGPAWDTPRCAASRWTSSSRQGFPRPATTLEILQLRRLESRRFSRRAGEPAATSRSPATGTRTLIVDGHMRERPRPGMSRAAVASASLRSTRPSLDGEQQGALLRIPSCGGTERFAALMPILPACDNRRRRRRRAADRCAAHRRCRRPATASMCHPRLLIRVGSGASAQVVVHHTGDDDAERFVNSYVEIEAGPRLVAARVPSAGPGLAHLPHRAIEVTAASGQC